MDKTCAIVVTYNRANTLLETIKGLENQSYPISGLFIFNNHSNDDTEKKLINNGFISNKNSYESGKIYCSSYKNIKIFYFKSPSNIGGAGGFSKSIEIASNFKFDYLWLMDDDVLPENDCLKKLHERIELLGVSAAIPNRTDDNFKDMACIELDFKDYHKFWTGMRKTKVDIPLSKKYIYICDMPFEGPLLRIDLVKKIGKPDAKFFYQYDDSDYAQKIQKYSKIIMVPDAKLHRQLARKGENNSDTEKPYNWKNYYGIRNNIIFDKRYGENWRVHYLSPLILIAHHLVVSKRQHNLRLNFPIIMKAYFDGISNKMGKRVDPN